MLVALNVFMALIFAFYYVIEGPEEPFDNYYYHYVYLARRVMYMKVIFYILLAELYSFAYA